jgi:hypothetical protein
VTEGCGRIVDDGREILPACARRSSASAKRLFQCLRAPTPGRFEVLVRRGEFLFPVLISPARDSCQAPSPAEGPAFRLRMGRADRAARSAGGDLAASKTALPAVDIGDGGVDAVAANRPKTCTLPLAS